MKVNAIEGRGTRKDFVDVYFLLTHFKLSELLEFYKQKYPEYSFFRALMSLTYFDDAEQHPMPKMLNSTSWDVMKQKIIAEKADSCISDFKSSKVWNSIVSYDNICNPPFLY